MLNHPVHLVNADKKLFPSAFIPFCGFGGKIMGQMIPNLKIPVCDSFQPRLLNDQLCYEIDLHNITNDEKPSNEDVKSGFVFVMDYNEDREGVSEDNSTVDEEDGFVKMLKEQVHDENHATIHLDTMGNACIQILLFIISTMLILLMQFRTCSLIWRGAI